MRIHYILHADFELPGIIETWANKNKFDQKFNRPFTGEKLPDSASYDLLIVMGGPQSPLHIEEAPYLKEEIELIQKSLAAGKPVLGFCLGAQLLGEALGAQTEHSPCKEVGVFPIELTQEGLSDPVLAGLPKRFPVVHWHNDMPGLTQSAIVLAKSEGCPRQIVRYSSLAYGFQCHPEMTRQNVEAVMVHCPDDLCSGKFVQPAAQFLASDFDGINSMMIQIMNNFAREYAKMELV